MDHRKQKHRTLDNARNQRQRQLLQRIRVLLHIPDAKQVETLEKVVSVLEAIFAPPAIVAPALPRAPALTLAVPAIIDLPVAKPPAHAPVSPLESFASVALQRDAADSHSTSVSS